MKELLENLKIEHNYIYETKRKGINKYNKAFLFTTFLLLIIVISLAVYQDNPKREVEVYKALSKQTNVQPSLVAGGYIKASRLVYVVPKISGRIIAIRVDEGDKVEKGELIALIEDDDYRASVEEAKAKLMLAEANLANIKAGSRSEAIANMKAQVESAEAEKEYWFKELERNKNLSKKGFISDNELNNFKLNYRVADKKVESLKESMNLLIAGPRKEEIKIAEAQVDEARAKLTIAQNNLSYTKVTAPFFGTILHKYKDVGDYVTSSMSFIENYNTLSMGTPIVAIADFSQLEVTVDINETDINKIKLNQPVEVIPDAYTDDTYPGKVKLISPKVDKNKNTIEVKIILTDISNSILKHDLSVKINFLHETNRKETRHILIPLKAVFNKNDVNYVYVVNNSKAYLKKVTIGEKNVDLVHIIDGISEGESIILSNINSLKEGDEVIVK